MGSLQRDLCLPWCQMSYQHICTLILRTNPIKENVPHLETSSSHNSSALRTGSNTATAQTIGEEQGKGSKGDCSSKLLRTCPVSVLFLFCFVCLFFAYSLCNSHVCAFKLSVALAVNHFVAQPLPWSQGGFQNIQNLGILHNLSHRT